jgi:hypothetical protein
MAGYYDFTVEKGVTFKRTLGWRVGGLPVDTTGFTARLEGRKSLTQPEPDFVLTSDPNGGIVLGGASGRIDITVTPEGSAALKSGIYFYWLNINTGGEITRLLEGRSTIKEGALL